MKRFIYVWMAAVAMSACASKPATVPATSQSESFDSLVIEIDSMAVSATLKVLSPIADTLQQRWLAQFVDSQMFFDDEDADGSVARPVFAGNLRSYLQACIRQKWDELRHDTFDGQEPDDDLATPEELAEAAMRDSLWLSTYQIVFSKAYETDSVVTFTSQYEFYVNNTPHPSFGGTGISFSKTGGQPVGHSLLKDTGSTGFRQLLKEGLRQWLTTVLEVEAGDDAQIKEYMADVDADPDAIALPELQPYLTAEGVVLPYMEDELVFSREPVRLVIPYDKVRPYLR